MHGVEVVPRLRLRHRILAAILAAALVLTGCSAAAPTPAPSSEAQQPAAKALSDQHASDQQSTPTDRVKAEVVRVVDGDTIEVRDLATGKTHTVRLIGVDTPETVHPQKPVEPYGPEASNYTKRRLQGQTVELEFDVEKQDRYGRLLAYVWLGEELFNATLVREGYAQVLTVPPNVKYADRFVALQREAREAKRGLWGLAESTAGTNQDSQTAQSGAATQGGQSSGTTPQDGQPSGTAAQGGQSAGASAPAPSETPKRGSFPPANGQCIDGGKAYIKGNRNSMIYHVPGGQYYDRTYAEECFYTAADAEAAGYRASKR